MEPDIITFLKQSEHNGDIAIWLMTTSGLVSGLLQPLDGKNETITLSQAFYYTGGFKLKIEAPSILINQIIGWGICEPEYQPIASR
jgi:hypothetical protein